MARQTSAIKFKFLTGDNNWKEHGGCFISPKFNNGEWDYWLVMDVCNLGSITDKGREYTEYSVTVYAVSPEAAGKSKLEEAIKSMGFERDEVAEWLATDEAKVEVLHSYGTEARLWDERGNNLAKLILKAKRDLYTINGMLGFFMDSPQNGIGSTGWDLIAGNTMAGLERYREAQARGEEVTYSPVMKVMDKISAK